MVLGRTGLRHKKLCQYAITVYPLALGNGNRALADAFIRSAKLLRTLMSKVFEIPT